MLGGGQSGTWTWDGANWTQQHPASAPADRQFQTMAYDDATQQVVLFGGGLVHNGPITGSEAVNDTWTWNGMTWTQQHPAIKPPNGGRSTCAGYDLATRQFLLFNVDELTQHPGTWSWTGTNWVQLTVNAGPTPTPGNPAGRCSMAYDPDLHALLLLQADATAAVDWRNGGVDVGTVRSGCSLP